MLEMMNKILFPTPFLYSLAFPVHDLAIYLKLAVNKHFDIKCIIYKHIKVPVMPFSKKTGLLSFDFAINYIGDLILI